MESDLTEKHNGFLVINETDMSYIDEDIIAHCASIISESINETMLKIEKEEEGK